MIASFLLLIVPPTVAFAWTRYRYADGHIYGNPTPQEGWTSGFADRQYNAAYRGPDYCYAWRVRYYRDTGGGLGDITWQHDSDCSPTSIGLTTGPRRAYCAELELASGLSQYDYNCDTTRP